MVAFVPKSKPLIQRLISNIAVQLCLLVTVIASVFLIVRHQQKMELAARVANVEDSAPTQIIERSDSASRENEVAAARVAPPVETAPPVEDDSASASSLAATAAASAPEPAAAPAQPAPASVVSADASAETSPAAPAAAAPVTTASVRMTFNEVPRAFLSELASEQGANAGSYGSIHYGLAADWTNRSKVARGAVNWRSLDASSPQSIKVGETTTVYRGPRDEATGDALGIWIFAKLVRIEDASVTLQFEVSRNLTNPGATGGVEQVNRLPLPEMTIPRGAAAFISGLVPHRQTALTQQEQRLYRGDRVLQIMTSEPFRSAFTELAVFIEPSVTRAGATAAPTADVR